MTDYRLCKWPSLEEWKKEMTTMEKISSNSSSSSSSSARNTTEKTYSNDYYISRKIDALNDEDGKFERFLENVKRAKMEGKDVTVITFSHFLPRIELIPEKRFLLYPKLTQAVGSHILNKRRARDEIITPRGIGKRQAHARVRPHALWLEFSVREQRSVCASCFGNTQRVGETAKIFSRWRFFFEHARERSFTFIRRSVECVFRQLDKRRIQSWIMGEVLRRKRERSKQ